MRAIASCVFVGFFVGCPAGPVIDIAEGEGEEGEGEVSDVVVEADNDTCADAIRLDSGVSFRMQRFNSTATLHNCSATTELGEDGIDDVAFVFTTTDVGDVRVTADGEIGADGGSYASPTLTLFDNPLCAFATTKVIDDRTCVGDGLSFDRETIMTVNALPAGTWYVVAETFGDLSPFDIRADF